MENQQYNKTDEVDAVGGWLVTHHTRTWDTRIRLDSLADSVNEKKNTLDAAQKAYDDEVARVATIQAQMPVGETPL